MTSYLIRRIWQMIPTLLGVILLIFILFTLFGGDPAEIIAGQNASAQQVAVIRQQLGLDQPWWVQLWIFFKEVVTFNWGDSWATRESVSHIFLTRLPATLTVMIPLFLLTLVLSVPIGAGRGLRARLAHRPADDDGDHGRTLDLIPRLCHRRPVAVRLQARPGFRSRAGRPAFGRT